jgi:hypothetical protein
VTIIVVAHQRFPSSKRITNCQRRIRFSRELTQRLFQPLFQRSEPRPARYVANLATFFCDRPLISLSTTYTTPMRSSAAGATKTYVRSGCRRTSCAHAPSKSLPGCALFRRSARTLRKHPPAACSGTCSSMPVGVPPCAPVYKQTVPPLGSGHRLGALAQLHRFEPQLKLLDLAIQLLRLATELHATQLGDQHFTCSISLSRARSVRTATCHLRLEKSSALQSSAQKDRDHRRPATNHLASPPATGSKRRLSTLRETGASFTLQQLMIYLASGVHPGLA